MFIWINFNIIMLFKFDAIATENICTIFVFILTFMYILIN